MADSTLTTSSATSMGTERGAGRAPPTVREQLDQASGNLAAAESVLTTQVPEPAALYDAVDGTTSLANSLARLVPP
ncbi:hypothetical protein [Saccharopolyspora phatthalungensis]|uniref:Uncharacterized protein n=1 Tax=Saccharopolyspora phatthalungensis TaxID=664693 RepID=A0A840QIP6_9PSEU|nr:hypothetical protein [Saccharopolyspora phatthalungensis]MBB5157293.1 hypothetical protein [Saccharopolyspora phatthalungensis]